MNLSEEWFSVAKACVFRAVFVLVSLEIATRSEIPAVIGLAYMIHIVLMWWTLWQFYQLVKKSGYL